jgi:hypothetical protein
MSLFHVEFSQNDFAHFTDWDRVDTSKLKTKLARENSPLRLSDQAITKGPVRVWITNPSGRPEQWMQFQFSVKAARHLIPSM